MDSFAASVSYKEMKGYVKVTNMHTKGDSGERNKTLLKIELKRQFRPSKLRDDELVGSTCLWKVSTNDKRTLIFSC